jgi:carbon monoxide dehydrogenase subunit G
LRFFSGNGNGRASTAGRVDAAMNATSNDGARLSRDIQAKIGEKLALLYLPALRQDIPQRLSELSRRLETTGKTRTRRSSLSRMLEAWRRRGAGS